jgi:hypothetical protein
MKKQAKIISDIENKEEARLRKAQATAPKKYAGQKFGSFDVNQLLKDPPNVHESKAFAAAQNNEIGNLQLLQSRGGQDLFHT